MQWNTIKASLSALILLGLSGSALAHGLIEEPASRNWYCGAITKPDQVANGGGAYPVCKDAFARDFNGGYQFMSVLTHARGRAVVTPLPAHVCGFGSETFQGGPTPWDEPINWPTNKMKSGRNKITWNISWGPHFDDTEEFRYWITKPGFQYTVGQPLKWSDFEEQAFCVLKYDDKNPSASPNVIPDKPKTQFNTYCEVPPRTGRHVIYGEWGRNQFTFERFHSCIDAVFDGGENPPAAPVARIGLTPNVAQFSGAGTLALSASASTGAGLQYQWSVSSPNPGAYTLENATSAVATLRLANPPAANNLLISLLVTNNAGTDTATATVVHVPAAGAEWRDVGALTIAARALNGGDTVRLRIVRSNGQDQYFPQAPLVLSASNAAADAWPEALANAVNPSTVDFQIGVLNANGDVVPVRNATSNRVYALADTNINSAFVEITNAPPTSSTCIVTVRSGASPYWAGLDLGTNRAEVVLDFVGSGIGLDNVRVDAGVFTVTRSGEQLTVRKPAWVTLQNPGYFGLNANNYLPLSSLKTPACR